MANKKLLKSPLRLFWRNGCHTVVAAGHSKTMSVAFLCLKMERIPKDYRRAYEQYLGVLLKRDIHVHHIDHNRSNHDFLNLVAIPAKLHGRYHFLEREYQIRCGVLKYRRPRQKTIDKFSYANYMSGEWRNLFRGSATSFINMSQSIHYLISDYEVYDKAKSDYMECLKLIIAHKKQQKKRA